ncbi:MAG: HNH endonuclease signature motif containing protein [Bacteroidales bacterium]
MKDFNLENIYFFVDIIDRAVRSDSDVESEFLYDEEQFISSATKFSKLTLLHIFIANKLLQYYRIEVYRNSDFLCEDDDWLNNIESLFEKYNVKIELFSEKFPDPDSIEDLDLKFKEWFDDNDDKFGYLFDKIAEDVFYILFANRSFLKDFNMIVANEVQNVNIPQNFKNKHGKIRRTNIPNWVKSAVFFRDKGRCIKCTKDLTGLIATDAQLHYDHIVPLNMYGVNDPSNIQLLCAQCNLKKSSNIIETSSLYSPWWKE